MATFKELLGFKKAFNLALEIQNISKKFPKDEQYSLTDQIRRCSRSVCVNISEGFRQLRYKAHFVAKMTDADIENTETQVWIDFGHAFGYIVENERKTILQQSEEIGRLLFHIIKNPEKYGAK